MSSIVVLANPHSGKNKKNPQIIENFRSILGTKGSLLIPQSLEELEKKIWELKEQNVDIVCINGGDGTIHKTVTSLFHVYGDGPWPKVVLLKGGTMNNIARNMGIPLLKNANSMLKDVIEGGNYKTVTKHPLIVDETYAGFIYGTSGISAFLEQYYDGGNASAWKGAVMAVRSILSALIGGAYAGKIFASRPIKISVDGENAKATHATNMGISTMTDVGFYLRPFYATLKRPDIAHMITMNCSPLYIAFALPQMWMARPTNKSYIEDMSGQVINMNFTGQQSYTIDGDLYPVSGSQRIRVGPAIEFIIGKQ